MWSGLVTVTEILALSASYRIQPYGTRGQGCNPRNIYTSERTAKGKVFRKRIFYRLIDSKLTVRQKESP